MTESNAPSDAEGLLREALKEAISQLIPFAEDGDQPAISAAIDNGRAALRAAPASGSGGGASEHWRCFHCNEVFTDAESAKEHFGPDEEWQAGCIDPLTRDEAERRKDQVDMYGELDREREENSRLTNRDYILGCFEADLAKFFNGAKSVHQAMLVLDAMEGRALAAEERLAAASPPSGDAVRALEPFAKIGVDVLENRPGWANSVFSSEWAGYRLNYVDFERAAATLLALPSSGAGRDDIAKALTPWTGIRRSYEAADAVIKLMTALGMEGK